MQTRHSKFESGCETLQRFASEICDLRSLRSHIHQTRGQGSASDYHIMTDDLTDQPDLLELQPNLSIRNIVHVAGTLRSALEAGQRIVLTIPERAEIDVSFLQLIEAARRHAIATHRSFALARRADGTLRDALQRSGFLTEADADVRRFWLGEGFAA